MIPDVLQAVVTFALQSSTLGGLCSGRIYGYQLPASSAEGMPINTVVISRSGGAASLGYLQQSNTRIDVKCYGATQAEAAAIYYAIHDEFKQMQRQRVGNCLLNSFTVEGGPMDSIEPQVEWPMVIGVYRVYASEIEVA